MSEEIPKLRMAPPDDPETLSRRFEREKRAALLQREGRLEKSLGNFRVGSVSYLNAVPLTRGLEDEIVFCPPSELAQRLGRDELDAALVSVTEVILTDRYDILDGIAVASLGEVKSVFLAHAEPLESIAEIACDPASLTSVKLLQVLLAERGLAPRLRPIAPGEDEEEIPNLLLIGDRAIEFSRRPHRRARETWDLGSAWFDLARLPFVYAVWALRRGVTDAGLRRQLREARDFGLETLDTIVRTREEFDYVFRKDYLGWHIHYHLGADEKRGLARFVELLRQHNLGPVHDPRFVS